MTKVKTLLLTRPKVQSHALAQNIETEFPDMATCLISPLAEITPTGALPDTSKFQAILFTSFNGVQSFADLGGTTSRKCYCVGARTMQAAKAAGLNAVSANGAAAELIAKVAEELTPANGPLLHVRGEHTAGDIAENLTAQGFTVEQAVVYRQPPCGLTNTAQQALAAGDIEILPLYSPLTARRMAEILASNSDWPTQDITALCLSKNVAAEIENLNISAVEIAAKPNGEAMLALIGRFLR